jgi:tRNA A-37 threonylcarbamoyl transferase component Bud32
LAATVCLTNFPHHASLFTRSTVGQSYFLPNNLYLPTKMTKKLFDIKFSFRSQSLLCPSFIMTSGWCNLLKINGSLSERLLFVLRPTDIVFRSKNNKLHSRIEYSAIFQVDRPTDGNRCTLILRHTGSTLTRIVFPTVSDCDSVYQFFNSKLERPKEVSISDFEMIRELGRGSYGQVHLVRLRSTFRLYAMKSLSKRYICEQDSLQSARLERLLTLSVRHPFIVPGFWAFQSATEVHIIMDYLPGGCLLDLITQQGRFSVDAARLYTAELSLAMSYLHSQGVLHRDIKPENILVDAGGHIQLTDFGTARIGLEAHTFAGTAYYQAPEMVKGLDYDARADLWSIGILLFEMLIGQPPYFAPGGRDNEVYAGIVSDAPVDLTAIEDETVRDLLQHMLAKDPDERMSTVNEVMDHPFFACVDWNALYEKRTEMPYQPGRPRIVPERGERKPVDGDDGLAIELPDFTLVASAPSF